MNKLYKFLAYAWFILSMYNLCSYFTEGHETGRLLLASLQMLLSILNWCDYKRGE